MNHVEIELERNGSAWIGTGTNIDPDWIDMERDGTNVDREGPVWVPN